MITVMMDPQMGYAVTQQVYGGIQIQINANPELLNMLQWYRTWGPVFNNPNPAVQATLQDLKTMHNITNNGQ